MGGERQDGEGSAESGGELLVLRGMTRFACLGGACEDTCCATWNVSVDALHFHALRARLEREGQGALVGAAFVEKPEAERSAWAHAAIRMREDDGRCPLLGADGLCEVHRRFGDELLPDVCSFYPRFVVEVEGRAELFGSLSCPEVARRLILDEDGLELELVEGEPSRALLGRARVLQRPATGRGPFVDELRGVSLMLLDRGGPLAERLYLIAFVAAEAEALIEAGAGQELGGELEPLLDDDSLAAMASERHEGPASPGRALEALFTQAARLRAVARPRLRERLDEALAAATSRGVLQAGGEASLARRWDSLPEEVREAISGGLERLAREHLFRELARPDTTFVASVRRLSLRLVLLRVLLACHPLADGGPASVGALLVELVSGTARVADHDAAARTFLDADAETLLPSLDAYKGLLRLL